MLSLDQALREDRRGSAPGQYRLSTNERFGDETLTERRCFATVKTLGCPIESSCCETVLVARTAWRA